jgi:hypothetical protein
MRNMLLSVLIALLFTPPSARASTVVQTLGDASVVRDSGAGTWTIGAGGATLTLALDASRDFQVLTFVSPSGLSWLVDGTAGTGLTLNGSFMAFGNAAAGFLYEDVTTSNDGHVHRLDAVRFRSADLRVVRHFAVVSGSPTLKHGPPSSPRFTTLALNLNAFNFPSAGSSIG